MDDWDGADCYVPEWLEDDPDYLLEGGPDDDEIEAMEDYAAMEAMDEGRGYDNGCY